MGKTSSGGSSHNCVHVAGTAINNVQNRACIENAIKCAQHVLVRECADDGIGGHSAGTIAFALMDFRLAAHDLNNYMYQEIPYPYAQVPSDSFENDQKRQINVIYFIGCNICCEDFNGVSCFGSYHYCRHEFRGYRSRDPRQFAPQLEVPPINFVICIIAKMFKFIQCNKDFFHFVYRSLCRYYHFSLPGYNYGNIFTILY